MGNDKPLKSTFDQKKALKDQMKTIKSLAKTLRDEKSNEAQVRRA